MFLLWNKWLPLVTKHIKHYNLRSYLDHLCDEYFGGLTLLYKFHCLCDRKTSIWLGLSLIYWSFAILKYIKGLVCLCCMDVVTFPTHTQAAFSQIMSSLCNSVYASNLQRLPDWRVSVYGRKTKSGLHFLRASRLLSWARWVNRVACAHDRQRKK